MTEIITVHGGLVAQAELKFTQSGTPFATFTVASSKRVQNRDTGQWEDGRDKLYLRCTAWGPLGENIHASQLAKGARVIVTGELLTREWEQDGQKRSQNELKVIDFGASLKHVTATVTRTVQGGSGASAGAGMGDWPSPPSNEPQNGFGDWSTEPGF